MCIRILIFKIFEAYHKYWNRQEAEDKYFTQLSRASTRWRQTLNLVVCLFCNVYVLPLLIKKQTTGHHRYLRTTRVRVRWDLFTRQTASRREPLSGTACTLAISSPAWRPTAAATLPSSTWTLTHTHRVQFHSQQPEIRLKVKMPRQ